MSNLIELKPVGYLNPFGKFCCTIGNLPSSYMTSLTYEEQLLWLCDYLQNTVIPAVNNNAEAVLELQNLFIELKNYVNNYFNDLDVQNEINKKLDEMAQSGELDKIISKYLDKVEYNLNIKLENYENDINNQFNNYKNTTDNKLNNMTNEILNINKKVNSVTSMSPSVVTSIEQMTDTNKIYVLQSTGEWYYFNENNWIVGGNYQASKSSLQVDNISTISNLLFNNIVPCMNFADNTNIQLNKYYYGLNIASADGYAVVPPFPVIKGITYKSSLYQPALAFSFIADENGNIISNEINRNPNNYTEFTPNVSGWCYITFQSVSTDNKLNNVMIYVKDNPPTDFIEFNNIYDFYAFNTSYKLILNKLNTVEASNITNIEVGENKNFSTIKEAIASIKNSSKSNKFNILIDDGTYNETNINIPDYVNLIGVSGNREKCIINGELPSNSSDNEISGTSTINFNYNSELHNLTINAKNMRYPIHDETNGSFKNWTQIVDNCIIQHFGNDEVIEYRKNNSLPEGNVWKSLHAFGMGASSGCKLTIKNSKLVTPETPFYTHSATNFEKTYLINIENCELISTKLNSSVFIDDTTSPINGNTVIINNTFMNSRFSIVSSNKTKCIVSGSIVPIYQKPERVLSDVDFPIFTDITKYLIANEYLEKGTFVTSTDGVHIVHATSNTPINEIIGYVVGNTQKDNLTMIFSKYMQPLNQTWPETPIESGIKLSLDDNGKIKQAGYNDIVIGVTQDRWYKLYL